MRDYKDKFSRFGSNTLVTDKLYPGDNVTELAVLDLDSLDD